MARVMRNPEVVCTELEGGAVLLNMETRFYYSLNEIGLEIWRLIESAQDGDELVRSVLTRFEGDEARVQSSVSRFVEELERERLVVAADGAVSERSAAPGAAGAAEDGMQRFFQPELVKHDEPLYDAITSPFDPQLPLAE